MVKRKPPELKPRRRNPSKESVSDAKEAESVWFSPAAIRETVESVVIAFVLAFLFRTFEAEAFVIPTGSMAPTLMGKHKDLECPMCHYRYQVSASDQQNTNLPAIVYRSTCPMCRYTADLRPENPDMYPSYDGDRILVAKFPYEFADPKRWDVIVFKFPGDSTMNYIKRLVGRPGERLQIHNGDLWVHEPGQSDDPDGYWRIARKPPAKLLAMLQPVFDNDFAPTITGAMGFAARWAPAPGPAGAGWTNCKDPSTGKEDLSSFESDGNANVETWIRYQHLVATPLLWQMIADAAKKPNDMLTREDCLDALKPFVKPQLISDFTAYNTSLNDQSLANPQNFGDRERLRKLVEQKKLNELRDLIKQMSLTELGKFELGYGQHWVGDLAVQFEIESKSGTGQISAELVKGGCRFQCHIDPAAGKTKLSITRDGPPDPNADQEARQFHATAPTPRLGAGRHTIIFSNVDDELRLWVDGAPVAFDSPATYDSERLKDHIPTASDLSPVGIAAAGAAVKISHIKVLRDIYYIAVFSDGTGNIRDRKGENHGMDDYERDHPDLQDPGTWPKAFSPGNMRTVTIPPTGAFARDPKEPEKDQFFALGDNSAQSSDGRLWVGQWTVERELLIGKALFIYWPHGWKPPVIPFPFNIIPNFGRMRLVR
jgi:signal peptidase I